MTGSIDGSVTDSSTREEHEPLFFHNHMHLWLCCSSDCDEYVDVRKQQCCAKCNSRKVFVTKSKLLSLFEASCIESFHLEIDFINTLLAIRPPVSVVEYSPIHSSRDDTVRSMESNKTNVSYESIPPAPTGRHDSASSSHQQDVELEMDLGDIPAASLLLASEPSVHSRNKGDRRTPRDVLNLRNHIAPGVTDLAPEPAVYSNLEISSKMERACLELEADLRRHYQENAAEYLDEMTESDIVNPTECMAGEPQRVEKGYYKVHLNSTFVTDNFRDSFLPQGMRVRTKTDKKAIAFLSTTVETLSNTHYDQDPSFLFVLKGKKTIMFAHPKWKRLYARFRSEAHSSIFDGVNPHEDYCEGWECLTLTAGDGFMLPQNWLHSVKSSPGTVAISFQVESTGELKNAPELNGAKRRAASPPLLQSVPSKRQKAMESKDQRNNNNNKSIKESSHVAVHSTTSQDVPLQSSQVKKPNHPRRQQQQQLETTCRSGGVRKSTRAKLPCGNDKCHNTFPEGGLMWMLIRTDVQQKEKLLPDSCPVVPKDYPKHLICFHCQPQNGQQFLLPSEILSNDEKKEFRDWRGYLYCPASKVDYEAQTNKGTLF